MNSGGHRRRRSGVSKAGPAARSGDKTADVTQQMGGLALEPRTRQAQVGHGSGCVVMDKLVTKTNAKDLSKMGSSGRIISLAANYFRLESRPTWCVYQYHVEFSPTVESSRMRQALLGNHREVLGDCYLFDGMSNMKSVLRLEHPVTELYSRRNIDDVNIRITVKFIKELHCNDPQLGHLFNTQMRRNLRHLEFLLIGPHYFDKDAVIDKPALNLQIWQGIITSIQTQEKSLMMMVDTCHKIIRRDSVFALIFNAVRSSAQNYKNIANKELVGSIVMTTYNNRTYRIEEICWDEKPTDSFESKDGPLTYLEYYKKQYDITIEYSRQPLLLCTSKEREIRGGQEARKKIMLVPELCMLTGLAEHMRPTFHLRKELANETTLDPQQRATNLQAFIKRLNANDDVKREMAAWDLKLSDKFVEFNGRVLPAEPIIQQGFKSNYDPKTADFSKEMRGGKMHVPKELKSWMIICTRADQSKCLDLLQNLLRLCPPMGMHLLSPKVFYIDDGRIGTYTQTLIENMKIETQMVIFIVPNNKKDRYDALKKLTCVDFPVPSQVVVSKTLSRMKIVSVVTKIAIQLNCKLGGEPWALKIPLKTPTMIIGYDTYLDSSHRGRCAGGFVASMNAAFTQWYSRANFHKAGGWQEISNYLYINLAEALKRFCQVNGCTPQLVIFFRDGVGDGQIRYVLEHEVQQMEKCFYEVLEGKECSKGEIPKPMTRFAFCVVNKRISTKFFAKLPNKRFVNPPPGTVVDHTVTRYDRYDFFLTSQSVCQGTVAPTMYNIIKDQSGLKPDHMQRLAYKLTHLYYNWPGTVRVPAPCQYAHKLAFLAGESLHREPDEKLSDKLFYL